MEIIPAIDLKDAKAVRLFKGQMSSAKIYSNEPSELAKIFENFGAKYLHIVDLDGAIAGDAINFKVIEKIASKTSLKIEVGGGIRDEARIKDYINLGVERVILGSVALKDQNFTKEMAKHYKIVVGIDLQDEKVATHGWVNVSEISGEELARSYAGAGLDAIITTDISKDGTLSGVNAKLTAKIADASKTPTIASGGVRDINDIYKLLEYPQIAGVIVGKAYYEGTLDLKKAFELAKNR